MIRMRFLDINKKSNKVPFVFVDDLDVVYSNSIFMNFLELSNARTLIEDLKALNGKWCDKTISKLNSML